MSQPSHTASPANTPTRRQMLFCAAAALGGLALSPATPGISSSDELSHTAESIHEEQLFNAPPSRVYAALTLAAQFDKVSKLSAAMRGGMPPGAKPTTLSRMPGGAFSLFGGYVTGRNIELVSNKRLVQAWRAASWAPGRYSIAKFELAAEGSGTRLSFDQAGFPQGDAAHLVSGWHDNYWKPLALFLAANR